MYKLVLYLVYTLSLLYPFMYSKKDVVAVDPKLLSCLFLATKYHSTETVFLNHFAVCL